MGLRLRYCPVEWFDWADLLVLVKHTSVDSNLYRSMHPDDAGWTLTNHLLAIIADALRWLQWSKTKDGRKGRDRPEPIPRPGVDKPKGHPKVKGGPRSLVRKMLGLSTDESPSRAERLAELFSGESKGSD